MIPMTPDAFASHKVIYPCLVQPLIHGERTLYQDGAFDTGNDSKIANILRDIFPPKVILDGIFENGVYRVFDVVSFKVPFKERFDSVVQVLRDTNKYQHSTVPVPTRKMFDETQSDDQYNQWLSEGYHGMVYRLGNCYYTKPTTKNKYNRNKQLLARKPQ